MCKQHKVPTPKIDRNGLPPLKLLDIPAPPPSRVPPLPDQLDLTTPNDHSNVLVEADTPLDVDSDSRHLEAESEELIKIRELQEILSDPSNYTKIVAEPERKAGISKEVAEMVKEGEIILERIDQQLLELGPFAKDTFLTSPTVPKDEPFPITFMPPNYLSYPPHNGLEMPPMGVSPNSRSRRSRGARGPPSSMHPPPLINNKAKRNSRGSETGSVSSPIASTPVDLRMELGGEVKERDASLANTSATGGPAKEPPKSKWRKVGSAGTATKPPLQSRSSSGRLQSNLQSPVLDRMAVLSPLVPSSSPAVPPVSASPPTASSSLSKTHLNPSVNSAASIIQPASEIEMQSLFSSSPSQWDLAESPPLRRERDSGERDLSATCSTSLHSSRHHLQQHHIVPGVHGRASSERGDSPLTQNISLNLETGMIDHRHHNGEHLSSRSTRTESHGSPVVPMPSHGTPDPIPRPLSRPHSHSSSPPSSHQHPYSHSHRPRQTPPPSHSDTHTPSSLTSLTSGNSEIIRHLIVSAGMPAVSRPSFPASHLTSSRDSHNSSPLVTSATVVSEERCHANSASPASEHSTKSWMQRSSASPSLPSGVGVGGDGATPLAVGDSRSRRRNSSTSTHRSGRLHSFDELRASPHATKPPPTPSHSTSSSNPHGGLDLKQPSTSSSSGGGGGGETNIGAPVNPYALWGAAGQFPPPTAGIPTPGQVIDPTSVSSAAIPRFPFPPTAAAAPFLPGANWIPTPGGMIAAAPGLPPMRPAMLPFDPNSPYKTPFLGAPFLAQYRYSLPTAQGLKAFPGLAGVSTGSGPACSSHPGTPTATIAMPFSQPALYPALQSGSALSAFKSLNNPSISNRLSPPIQQLLGAGSKEDKPSSVGVAGGELPSPAVSIDKLPGLNLIQPPGAAGSAAAAALMAAGTNLNLMPYLGMPQMPFSIGGIPPPATMGQQTPGGGVGLFNARLSTLASAGVHTGSEGNLTAVGAPGPASKDVHRTHQRRGSAASIDVSGLSVHNESPPNQTKKGFLGRSDAATGPGGGKWKPVTEHSPPVSQMLFNMSASPSSGPFGPAMIDARVLPNSGHLMTSSLGQVLPLSFGTPPTHQQMRGKTGIVEGPGRGSPRGTPDKIKLRIHQVKNDDFKLQSKPDRRRRKWKNKGQEVISLGPDPVAPSTPPSSGKQTASQLRRVKSDTARKTSSTPPSSAPIPDNKDEVVDVGDSSDNNYALNMLATMSTMQSREQSTSNDGTTAISASPLTISTTSMPSSEPSKHSLMHSPVSLAGAKSLLMLGKDVHVKESAKSDTVGTDATAHEVTNVESTAVDSLLQLSGAVLQRRNTAVKHSTGSVDQNGASSHNGSMEEEFQRREIRSESFSAAEAMLMMGSTPSSEPLSDPATSTATERRTSLQEVFNNGSGIEKQPSGGDTREELNVSKIPDSLTIDSEATDTDSEATLSPQSPAKRIPSFSPPPMEDQEMATGADSSSGMELKQTVGEPSPPSATIPDVMERPHEAPPLDEIPESSTSITQLKEKTSVVKDILSDIRQPSAFTDAESKSFCAAALDTESPTTATSGADLDTDSAVDDSLGDVGKDSDIDGDLPPSKRLKLVEENEEDEKALYTEPEPERSQNQQRTLSEAFSELQSDVTEQESCDPSEVNLKQDTNADCPTIDQNSANVQQDKVADNAKPAPLLARAEAVDMVGSPKQKISDKVDNVSKEDDLSEPAKHSPSSADEMTSWSAFAGVAQASYKEKEREDGVVEKVSKDSEVRLDEEKMAFGSPLSSCPKEDVYNKSIEKLKIDISGKRSSVSSLSSPPFTPDPPIEVDVFEKLPPTPKLASKSLESDAVLEEALAANHSDFSLSKDKEPAKSSSSVATTTDSTGFDGGVNSTSVSSGPQNRLVVSKPSPNRMQHRKHMTHSSKLGRDGKSESRKRMRPLPDSQMRLFEVDTVSVTTTSTTSAATPLAHTQSFSAHSTSKEKRVNSERGSREDTQKLEDRHSSSSSVRKFKKLGGHSSSKSTLSGQKQSKHNAATGKDT